MSFIQRAFQPSLASFSPIAWLGATGALVAASACGDDGADPASAQERVTDTVPEVVDSTADSMALLTQSETLQDVGASLDQVATTLGIIRVSEDDGTAGRWVFQDESGVPPGGEMSGDEIAAMLTETILIEENYEGDGYYRIPAEAFCPADPTTGTPEAECVEEVNDAELRVRAVLADPDGVDLSLAVGGDRVEPIVFELRPASVAAVVNFGELREAIVFFANLAEEAGEGDAEDVLDEIPEVFEGEVAATLTVYGEEHVGVAGAVREEIRIEDDDVSFSLAARDPIFELEANGPEETVTVGLDVGPATIRGPWELFAEDSAASGELEIDWQGLSASASLQEDARTLQIEDISLGEGTSSLSLNGDELIAVDLNADAGRSFTLTVHPDDAPLFGFDPELDIGVTLGLEPLAEAGDDVPEFALGDFLQFAVTGSEPTLQPLPAGGEFGGGIRVDSGELSISAGEAEREVTVDEGECLVERDPEEGDHPFVGAFRAGDCE